MSTAERQRYVRGAVAPEFPVGAHHPVVEKEVWPDFPGANWEF